MMVWVGMPADGISLPLKRGDFGTSRWPAWRLGYINSATGRRGHDRWPSDRHATEKCDELAARHSITSSAPASSVGGISQAERFRRLEVWSPARSRQQAAKVFLSLHFLFQDLTQYQEWYWPNSNPNSQPLCVGFLQSRS
jgi:hypothetical protein